MAAQPCIVPRTLQRPHSKLCESAAAVSPHHIKKINFFVKKSMVHTFCIQPPTMHTMGYIQKK